MPVKSYESDPRRRGPVPGYKGLWWSRMADGTYHYELKLSQKNVDHSGVIREPSGRPTTSEAFAIRAWKKATNERDEGGTPLSNGGVRLDTIAVEAFAALATKTTSGDRSKRTHRLYEDRYRLHISPTLGNKRLSQIDKREIERWLIFLRAQKKPGGQSRYAEWTIYGIERALMHVFSYAKRQGYLSHDPYFGVDSDLRGKPKDSENHENRRLRPNEIEALIASASDTYRDMIATLAYTGMRIGECCGVVWSDIDFEEGVITVTKQLEATGKDGEDARVDAKWERARTTKRKIPISSELRKVLTARRQTEWAKGFGRAGHWVFTTTLDTGRAVRADNLRKRGVYAAAEKAGLGPVKPHDLRHTFASTLIEKGMPVNAVAAILGDSPEMIWNVYGKSFQDKQERVVVVGILDAVFGG